MASFGQDRAGGQNHDRLDGAMANVAPAPERRRLGRTRRDHARPKDAVRYIR